MQTIACLPALAVSRSNHAAIRPAARGVSVLKQAREVHVAHRSTVVVKALETTVPPTPMGLPSPKTEPRGLKPRWTGFYQGAEVINGRAAMIGLFALMLLEGVAGTGILNLMGIETGNGIDIGL
eukprot:CAMPEP_0114236070 /NCGR_PEP_ID=MMETSP0058-20121206/6617_1 /TAXON_ID=36894 /ORGANISM="Pyramimonas parkeae, CCMP726" /LENGTH=123 /DNA_ID=CAMNT_0001347933 /DNA_START=85 /DNA_END=456 /DNA_ORIENTATION=+